MAAASSEQSIGVDQVNTAITQMDQVTQSNSAQTQELASTAQAFAEQATRLMELVSTFTLGDTSQSSRGERGRQPSAHSHRHPTGAALRPGKPATKGAAGKPAPSAPGQQRTQSAALVGSSAGRSDDASFEEF
jgi:methyl-accepting chemotaxis protein